MEDGGPASLDSDFVVCEREGAGGSAPPRAAPPSASRRASPAAARGSTSPAIDLTGEEEEAPPPPPLPLAPSGRTVLFAKRLTASDARTGAIVVPAAARAHLAFAADVPDALAARGASGHEWPFTLRRWSGGAMCALRGAAYARAHRLAPGAAFALFAADGGAALAVEHDTAEARGAADAAPPPRSVMRERSSASPAARAGPPPPSAKKHASAAARPLAAPSPRAAAPRGEASATPRGGAGGEAGPSGRGAAAAAPPAPAAAGDAYLRAVAGALLALMPQAARLAPGPGPAAAWAAATPAVELERALLAPALGQAPCPAAYAAAGGAGGWQGYLAALFSWATAGARAVTPAEAARCVAAAPGGGLAPAPAALAVLGLRPEAWALPLKLASVRVYYWPPNAPRGKAAAKRGAAGGGGADGAAGGAKRACGAAAGAPSPAAAARAPSAAVTPEASSSGQSSAAGRPPREAALRLPPRAPPARPASAAAAPAAAAPSPAAAPRRPAPTPAPAPAAGGDDTEARRRQPWLYPELVPAVARPPAPRPAWARPRAAAAQVGDALCAVAAALPGAPRPPPAPLDFGDLAERLHAGGAAAAAAAAGGEAPALERARVLLLPSAAARRTRARAAAAKLATALLYAPLLPRAPRQPAGLAAGLPGPSPLASPPPPPRGALATGGPDPAAADWGPGGAGSGAGLPRVSLARIARGRDFIVGP
jgi:hypothetical protein